MERYVNKKIKINTFLIIFLIILLFNYIVSKRIVYYDSKSYWTLGDEVIKNGFLAYPESFRGYFFPCLISLLKEIGIAMFSSKWILFMVFGSLCASFIITIAIPSLLDIKNITKKRYFIGTIINTVIFLYFWKDSILYPLTDIFAIFSIV